MKNFKKILLPTLFTIITILVAGEFLLRIKGVFLTYPEKLNGHYVSQYDSENLKLPNLEPNTIYPSLSKEFNYESKINSIGFRERDVPFSKRNDEKRIILVGDSFVQGIGTPQDSTWTRLLEQGISESLNDSNYVVYSGGISGSDPIYGFEIFKNSLLQLNPDVVIICINHTDFNEYLVRGGFERFDENGKIHFSSPINYEKAYEKFHLVRFYTHIISGRDQSFYKKKERKRKLQESITAYVELIKQYKRLGIENNFKSYPLMYPLTSDIQVKIALDSNYMFSEMNILTAAFRKENFNLIDLYDCVYDVFNDLNSLNVHYHKIDRHYNSKGYKVLADCTLKELEKLSIIKAN